VNAIARIDSLLVMCLVAKKWCGFPIGKSLFHAKIGQIICSISLYQYKKNKNE
jgi:hypothetical protein